VSQRIKTRVIVAHSDQRVRSALRLLLREEPELTLIGESSDLPNLVSQIRQLKPDLVLLDWELPGRPAAALLLAQTTLDNKPRVIVFSARPELEEMILAAGADRFVSKGDAPEALLSAFRQLMEKSREEVTDREEESGD
jgi:DNA-binding NarL/FixJ family response regulator